MVTIQSELVVPRKRNFQILIPNKTQFQFRKLETVFKTVLGQRKPTSLPKTQLCIMPLKTLPALNSDSLLKQGLCVEQALKKHLPDISNLRGVKWCTTQKLSLSAI